MPADRAQQPIEVERPASEERADLDPGAIGMEQEEHEAEREVVGLEL